MQSVFSFVNPAPEPSNGKIRQIWPYQFIAENFALADNMYQANQGPSLPAHQYLIAGQSGGYANNPKKQGPSTAPYALADNNVGGCGQVSGLEGEGAEDRAEPWHTESGPCNKVDSSYCITGSPNHTSSVDMADDYFSKRNLEYNHYTHGGNPKFVPCENYNTIFDLLDASGQPGIWEYHAHSFGSYWNAPVLVSRFANCNGEWGHKNPPPQCDPVSQDVVDPEGYTFVTQEVAQGNLPAVTYLTPCPGDSDHPNSIKETGPSWVAWLINAIGQNPNLWPNTAVFVVWDDWGGWYDHIPPAFSANEILYPKPDAYEWGYRVPFLAVSAYPALGLTGMQGGYVSHQPRSMSAILTFIENNFKIQGSGQNTLGSLGTDDAVNDPLGDLFDFSRAARAWPTIPATDPFKPLLTKGRNPQPYCERDPL